MFLRLVFVKCLFLEWVVVGAFHDLFIYCHFLLELSVGICEGVELKAELALSSLCLLSESL